MRKLLLILLVACGNDSVERPDAFTCNQNLVCQGALQIADVYCQRQNTCFGGVASTCITDVYDSLCSENDCEAYYPEANRAKLQDCLTQYMNAPCDGPNPPICKLY